MMEPTTTRASTPTAKTLMRNDLSTSTVRIIAPATPAKTTPHRTAEAPPSISERDDDAEEQSPRGENGIHKSGVNPWH